jgi:hypothetical protein
MQNQVMKWTCDKCGRTAETPTDGKASPPARAPRGWSSAEIKPINSTENGHKRVELCEGCSMQILRFVETHGAPETADKRWSDSCPECGSEIGEPCKPDCIRETT